MLVGGTGRVGDCGGGTMCKSRYSHNACVSATVWAHTCVSCELLVAGGDGDGGGGGGSPLRQIGGRISGRDYPRDLLRAGLGGTVWVRYVVGTNGRVGECRIARSSGYPELDETTCRLIVERFRFKPRRDASGRKVSGVVVEDHRWVVDEPPPGDDR